MLVRKEDDRKVKMKLFSNWRAAHSKPQLVLTYEETELRVELTRQEQVVESVHLPLTTWEEELAGIRSFIQGRESQPQTLAVLLEPRSLVQLLLHLPPASPGEVAKMLPWELGGYLAGKLEDYAYSYLPVEQSEDGWQLLVQALPKRELDQWEERGQQLQLPLVLCRGQLNRATWPQGLAEPTSLAELNLRPPTAWGLSWQWLPCCQVLAAVMLLCSLSTWSCLYYQQLELEKQNLAMEQQLQQLEPWPQRYSNCVRTEAAIQRLGQRLHGLETKGHWSSLLRQLGGVLPGDTWLESLRQRSTGQELELVGATLVSQSLPQLVTNLEGLPQIKQARLLSTEAKGTTTSYRILVEVGR